MVENSRTRMADAGRGRRRSMSRQKWGAVIGGSALALYGITRRGPLGVALAAGGGTVAGLAGTRRGQSQEPSTWTSRLINCSPEEAYRFCRCFEKLPRFLN